MAEATVKTAEQLGREQRAISVSEFFEKNRHLLGFDNPTKALLTVVKEAVDNSLDACEEARILPEIKVKIEPVEENVFRVTVEDNGPGIVKEQIPPIFARLLYGSKFGRGKQARGQQGIGISAAVLYAQLTTGKPAIIHSKPRPNAKTHKMELKIDTAKNEPKVINEEDTDALKHTGTRVILEIQGKYIQSKHAVDEYIRQTAIMNPHSNIYYENPLGEKFEYRRSVQTHPKLPKEIRPHPHGVEIGILERMAHTTKARTVSSFLQKDFCRVGSTSAEEICRLAGVEPNTHPHTLTGEQIKKLYASVQRVKLMRPPTDCLAPIGTRMLEEGLRAEFKPEYVKAITREPVVYRGNPFQIEAAIAYGGALAAQPKEGEAHVEEAVPQPVKLIRYANKMPLLYEQSSCALTKAAQSIKWRRYGLDQPGGGLPYGPAVIAVHICSTWVPYTSEGKEAIASYPEIIEEVRLAIQECARDLERYISHKTRHELAERKREIFRMYSEELAASLSAITGANKDELRSRLLKIAEKMYKRGEEEAEEPHKNKSEERLEETEDIVEVKTQEKKSSKEK